MIAASLHLGLVALLAALAQDRILLLRDLRRGLPRYLASLGLTLFLVNWLDFLAYVTVGWGRDYLAITWIALIGATGWFATRRDGSGKSSFTLLLEQVRIGLRAFPKWNRWFIALSAFVLIRFYWGLETVDGSVWCNFNFVDTPFHLSVANAFLASPAFPPMDLDMAPFPLKYHFLADFYVAHLATLGQDPLQALWVMNCLGAAVMVGTLWATFERWLRLPPKWVMLAAVLFLFLNTALVNVVHYLTFRPSFFNPATPFDGLFAFPFYNFESILGNLIEPQRGLLFSLPIMLLIMHAVFPRGDRSPTSPQEDSTRARRVTLAFGLVCLLPFSHIVGFAVLGLSLVPALWQERSFLLRRWRWWTPVFALGGLQLLYLLAYGPPQNTSFDSWQRFYLLPEGHLPDTPRVLRRLVFWFFANGDFLVWGGLFAGLALASRAPRAAPLRRFLARWKWYFASCAAFFVLINFYRYAFDWGDSNKFVLFLNLGLSLVIALGAAQWLAGRAAWMSRALWVFFAALCLVPHAYESTRDIVLRPVAKTIIFQKNGLLAAEWLKAHAEPGDLVLTAANNTIHFVTPLAGRPTFAGIYGAYNPYRQDERREQIRRFYEECDFSVLRLLPARFISLSRNERRRYKLHPYWTTLLTDKRAVLFSSGRIDEWDAAFILDAGILAKLRPPAPRPAVR